MKEGWGIYYDSRTDEFVATDGSQIFILLNQKFK